MGFVMPYQFFPNKMGLVNITHKIPNGNGAAAVKMSNKKEMYILNLLLPKIHIVTRKMGLGIKIRVNNTEGTRFTSSKFKAMLKLRPMFILPQREDVVHILGSTVKVLNLQFK